MPKVLTVEEAAAELHLSKQTVWAYVRDGKIPARKVGKRYLIPQAAIEDMLQPKAAEPPQGGAADA